MSSAPVADLGLYLHVPFCKHACPYCDFYKMELRDRPARERLDYPQRLAAEHASLLDAHPELAVRPLATIYFGGGTPSTLSPPGVAALIALLKARHSVAIRGEQGLQGRQGRQGPEQRQTEQRQTDPDSIEVTLEANPENLTPARCAAWRAAGVTRLSIGVQSFDEADLVKLERLHGPRTIAAAVANARAAGIDNLSLDLMFALPGQTRGAWLDGLRRAVDLAPDHLSFYGLTIHEHTPFDDEARAGRLALPAEDDQAAMYLDGAALLDGAGFEHYEISNFARPGRHSRHNVRYWSRADVVGLGPGAHSSLGALRWNNPPDIDAWKGALADGRPPRTEPEVLPASAALDEALFCGLRRREGFALAGPDATPAARRFAQWLASPTGRRAVEEGWVATGGGRGWLTRAGWVRSDALLATMVG